ncbi:MAG: hypothetical protein HYT94_03685 [Parcubacteria group bacterium]|nr:hypothetical protein [Parcubacteria group bacterium]
MTTPSHILYNLAILGKKGDARLNAAAGLGALFPDSITFIFFFFTSIVQSLPHEVIWRDLYFNSGWNNLFNLSHSFWLLPLGLFLCAFFKQKYGAYFFGSAFLHSVMDFFVHADDAYAHFYPLGDWRFHSPVSYWNPAHYGHYVSAVEILFALAAVWVLRKRTDSRRTKQILFGIGAMEIVFLVFSLMRIL